MPTYLADYLNALTSTELIEIRAALELRTAVDVLGQSGVAVTLTGSTAETILATVTIPAGTMAINDSLEVTALYRCTNGADDKFFKHRLGGIAGSQLYASSAQTTINAIAVTHIIQNRGTVATQVSTNSGTSTPTGTATVNPFTSSVNMANAQDLVFTGQLENAADSIILERYRVVLFRSPI